MILNFLGGPDGPYQWSAILAATLLYLISLYLYTNFRYHQSHEPGASGKLPPKYPTLIPYLGVVIPLLWKFQRGTIERFTFYKGQATTVRLSLFPGINLYLFQDTTTIRQLWRESSLFDVLTLHIFVLQNGFGLPKEAVKIYLADRSGTQVKPSAGSNIPEDRRIHRIIYENDQQALSGIGLPTTFGRYREAITRIINEIASDEWIELPDLWVFMQDTVGAALIESILGPSLLQLNPNFMRSLFEFDRVAPILLKGIPSPGARRIREQLLCQFRYWYAYARKNFTEASIYQDGDGDPFWGSNWTRVRHKFLPRFFNDDAMSSVDLGVAWGAVTNAVPCMTLAMIDLLRDPAAFSHLQNEVHELCAGQPLSSVNTNLFSNHSLLCAIYAETLRLHVTVFIPIHPVYGEVATNKWRIPKGSFGLVSSAVCHNDKNVWNTKEGLHPLDSFWPERFLVDPADPLSGPINPKMRPVYKPKETVGNKPYFTTEGLDASWIPYGGGRAMCPGRFLFKNIMTFTCAMFAVQFEIALLTDSVTLSKDRFGLGIEQPTRAVPFRIRRKQQRA